MIENVDRYGWDYRLLTENNGRYDRKNDCNIKIEEVKQIIKSKADTDRAGEQSKELAKNKTVLNDSATSEPWVLPV